MATPSVRPAPASDAGLVRALGLGSTTLFVIGSVIGSGIFLTTGSMAAVLPSASLILIAWVLGGVIALCGGLTYAEMGAMYPRSGGTYTYLREAFGPTLAFIYGMGRASRVLQRRDCRRRHRFCRVRQLLRAGGVERARAVDAGDADRALEDLGRSARGGRLHRLARLDQLRWRAIRQPGQRGDDHREDCRAGRAAADGRSLRRRVTGLDAGRSSGAATGRCLRRCDDRRPVGQRCLVQRHLDCRRGEGPATQSAARAHCRHRRVDPDLRDRQPRLPLCASDVATRAE